MFSKLIWTIWTKCISPRKKKNPKERNERTNEKRRKMKRKVKNEGRQAGKEYSQVFQPILSYFLTKISVEWQARVQLIEFWWEANYHNFSLRTWLSRWKIRKRGRRELEENRRRRRRVHLSISLQIWSFFFVRLLVLNILRYRPNYENWKYENLSV